MKWSWRLGRLFGVRFQIHWTFLLLIGWILFISLQAGKTLASALWSLAFVLSIFACVVLHELGHALTARRFGIATRDITLLPIGGVARLERMPEQPRQELLVAVAGPAVNIVIAAVLLLILALAGKLSAVPDLQIAGRDFFAKLMLVNVALVVFNMLPAFPMDGGRVLRALLAYRMNYLKATQIAAGVGQMMAILFGCLGFFSGNLVLVFVAIFVYLGASGEMQTTRIRAAFEDVLVHEAMMTRFHVLGNDDTLEDAVEQLLAGSQQDFPVVNGDAMLGVIHRNDLIRALANDGRNVPVREVMKDCLEVKEQEPLEQALRRMQKAGCKAAPVMNGSRLVGLLTLENIAEWLMVFKALRAAPRVCGDGTTASRHRLEEYVTQN